MVQFGLLLPDFKDPILIITIIELISLKIKNKPNWTNLSARIKQTWIILTNFNRNIERPYSIFLNFRSTIKCWIKVLECTSSLKNSVKHYLCDFVNHLVPLCKSKQVLANFMVAFFFSYMHAHKFAKISHEKCYTIPIFSQWSTYYLF